MSRPRSALTAILALSLGTIAFGFYLVFRWFDYTIWQLLLAFGGCLVGGIVLGSLSTYARRRLGEPPPGQPRDRYRGLP